MSDLSSIFDILKGYPEGSALTYEFVQSGSAASDITEGTIVSVIPGSSPTAVDRHASSWVGPNSENMDHPWIVIRGKESSEAVTAKKLTCLKMRTGMRIRIPYATPPAIGSLLWSANGVLTDTDPGSHIPHLAKVIDRDNTDGWIVFES